MGHSVLRGALFCIFDASERFPPADVLKSNYFFYNYLRGLPGLSDPRRGASTQLIESRLTCTIVHGH